MPIYDNMLPFFVITLGAGAAYMAWVLDRIGKAKKRDDGGKDLRLMGLIGGLLGAVVGILAPLVIMLPLQSCTFAPEVTALDYRIGIVLFFGMTALCTWAAGWLAQFALASRQQRARLIAGQSSVGLFRSPMIVPALLLAPTIIILIIFVYLPAFETFRLGTLLVRLGAPRTRFRCLTNYTELIDPSFSMAFWIAVLVSLILGAAVLYSMRIASYRDAWFNYLKTFFSLSLIATAYLFLIDFWSDSYQLIFFNTIFISSLIVIIGLILALAIAYLAFQPVRGASIYRTLLIWPYAISPAVAGILFAIMFDPTAGIIDHLLKVSLGVELPPILRDRWLARTIVILASVWKTLGYNILFYLAGLQNVPKDLLEAAAIDGANAWKRFRHVVIPSLSPITFFLIITNLTYAFFDIFGTIDYLTKGAPARTTSVQIYEIFRVGIVGKDLGRAAAQSTVLFLMVIVITVWQFRTSGRRVSYGA